MVSADTNTTEKIITQINTGKANTVLLKDFIVDLFVNSHADKFKDVNFDKGIEWPEYMFKVLNTRQLAYTESTMLGNYEAKFYTFGFDAECILNGWQRADLVANYTVNFTTMCTISVVSNYVVFKAVDAEKTIITATENLMVQEG